VCVRERERERERVNANSHFVDARPIVPCARHHFNKCTDDRYCNTLHTATHCNTLPHTSTYLHVLQHAATRCNTLQHAATCCNTHCTANSHFVDVHPLVTCARHQFEEARSACDFCVCVCVRVCVCVCVCVSVCVGVCMWVCVYSTGWENTPLMSYTS